MRFPRTALAEYAQRAAAEKLLTGPEGNLSLKLKEKIYITPSNVFKEKLRPEDITVLDPSGKVIEGRTPSSEAALHLRVYENRPEVGAIIHAHPPYTLALSLAGEDFSQAFLAETVLYLGEIGVVPFLPPGSKELAEAVAQAAKDKEVLVLERHGAVALGRDLAQAFTRLLILEKTVQILYLARTLKKDLPPLTEEEVKALLSTTA